MNVSDNASEPDVGVRRFNPFARRVPVALALAAGVFVLWKIKSALLLLDPIQVKTPPVPRQHVAKRPVVAPGIGDVILLAIPFGQNESVAQQIGAFMDGKILIDATNVPLGDDAGRARALPRAKDRLRHVRHRRPTGHAGARRPR